MRRSVEEAQRLNDAAYAAGGMFFGDSTASAGELKRAIDSDAATFALKDLAAKRAAGGRPAHKVHTHTRVSSVEPRACPLAPSPRERATSARAD